MDDDFNDDDNDDDNGDDNDDDDDDMLKLMMMSSGWLYQRAEKYMTASRPIDIDS